MTVIGSGSGGIRDPDAAAVSGSSAWDRCSSIRSSVARSAAALSAAARSAGDGGNGVTGRCTFCGTTLTPCTACVGIITTPPPSGCGTGARAAGAGVTGVCVAGDCAAGGTAGVGWVAAGGCGAGAAGTLAVWLTEPELEGGGFVDGIAAAGAGPVDAIGGRLALDAEGLFVAPEPGVMLSSRFDNRRASTSVDMSIRPTTRRKSLSSDLNWLSSPLSSPVSSGSGVGTVGTWPVWECEVGFMVPVISPAAPCSNRATCMALCWGENCQDANAARQQKTATPAQPKSAMSRPFSSVSSSR